MQVFAGVVVDVEVTLGNNPKGTDRGQRAAVVTVKLIDTVTAHDQLALLTAWQIEVAHQAIPRIVFIPVARVVHVRPFVAEITRVVFARIAPSSIGHRSLRCLSAAVGWSVKTPLQLLRGVVQGSADSRVVAPLAFSAWSFGNPGSGHSGDRAVGFGPRAQDGERPAADQITASHSIPPNHRLHVGRLVEPAAACREFRRSKDRVLDDKTPDETSSGLPRSAIDDDGTQHQGNLGQEIRRREQGELDASRQRQRDGGGHGHVPRGELRGQRESIWW